MMIFIWPHPSHAYIHTSSGVDRFQIRTTLTYFLFNLDRAPACTRKWFLWPRNWHTSIHTYMYVSIHTPSIHAYIHTYFCRLGRLSDVANCRSWCPLALYLWLPCNWRRHVSFCFDEKLRFVVMIRFIKLNEVLKYGNEEAVFWKNWSLLWGTFHWSCSSDVFSLFEDYCLGVSSSIKSRFLGKPL